MFLRLNIEAQYPELYIKGLILGVVLTNFVQKGAFYNNLVGIDKEFKNIEVERIKNMPKGSKIKKRLRTPEAQTKYLVLIKDDGMRLLIPSLELVANNLKQRRAKLNQEILHCDPHRVFL